MRRKGLTDMGLWMISLGIVLATVAAGGNLAVNGEFSGTPGGPPSGWRYQINHDARASMTVAKGAGPGSMDALRIVNASPLYPNVFAGVSQELNLKKDEVYTVSMLLRGKNVKGLTFIGGKSWTQRVHLTPTPEWRKISFPIRAAAGDFGADGKYPIRINTEDQTDEAMVADLRITPREQLTPLTAKEFQTNRIELVYPLKGDFSRVERLPDGVPRFHIPADAFHCEPVGTGAPEASVVWAYDDKGLILLAEVIDHQLFTSGGEGMWQGDSLQIMLEPDGKCRKAPGAGDYEIGISPGNDGNTPQSWCYTLSRPLTGTEVELHSRKTANGYFIAARFPWGFLGGKHDLPSANLIVNDSDGGTRKVAFLASGIHHRKSCEENTLLVLDDGTPRTLIQTGDLTEDGTITGKLLMLHYNPAAAKITATDSAGKKREAGFTAAPGPVPAAAVGEFLLHFVDAAPGRIALTAEAGGKKLAEAELFKENAFADFKAALKQFLPQYAEFGHRATAFDNAYLKALTAICGRQIDLLKTEARIPADRSAEELAFYGKRGLQEISGMKEMLARGETIMSALRENPQAPQYAAADRTGTDICSGFGHGSQVVRDLPFFPELGVNFIQMEIGPSSVVTGENPDGTFVIDRVNLKKRLESVMKPAKENGIFVCLLLSPHYFPEWMLEKDPGLKIKGGYGFIRYEFLKPEAKRLLKVYLEAVTACLRESPWLSCLHSICISNEPVFHCSLGNEFIRTSFFAWLEKKYRTIDALNRQWDTASRTFPDAAGTEEPKLEKEKTGRFYDFHLFAQEEFAGWHRWMAEIVKSGLPEIPLHSKFMLHETLNYGNYAGFNVNPERWSEIMDLNGNDNFFTYAGGSADWIKAAYGYAQQQSFKKVRIVNSENHIIQDRDMTPKPYGFLYTALFQQYVYGMEASAIWVWENYYYDHAAAGGQFTGDIYRRPLETFAAVSAGMDAMRLAPEIKAFFDADPKVCLLYSNASMLLDPESIPESQAIFKMLSFTGRKIGFISEKQLQEGKLGKTKILVLAETPYLEPETMAALAQSSHRLAVVTVNRCCLFDPYGKPLDTAGFRPAAALNGAERDRLPSFINRELGALPYVLTSNDGLTDINWELVPDAGGSWLLNAVNYGVTPRKLTLRTSGGKPFKAVDLISGRVWQNDFELSPLQPILLRIIEE